MEINLRRCYFHSIVPLRRKNVVFNFEEGQFDRLKLMLESGHIYPGGELGNILTNEYDSFYSSSDSVFLAQHINTELPCYGGSFYDGEFSAYLEHIAWNPSWVFSEYVVNGKRIENRSHMLSEEVCIQGSIDLHEAIALMLPYETPAITIGRFLKYYDLNIFDDDKDKLDEVLKKREELWKVVYLKINRWKSELLNNGYNIPCINMFGGEYDLDKEREYLLEKEEVVKRLIRK